MSDLNLIKVANLCSYNVYKDKEKNETLLKSLQSNLINGILDKYIEKSLLSHWKSAIENIVLENKQNRFKEIVKSMKTKNNFISTKLVNMICFSLYRIIIKEKKINGCGFMSSDNDSHIDIIIINKKMTIQEKRCVVAHELSHIIVDRLLKGNKKVIKNVDWDNLNEEELINILMCYILYDKSSFYKNANGKLKDFQVNGPSEFKKLRNDIISKYKKNL